MGETFSAFRTVPYPTHYNAIQSGATVDLVIWGLLAAVIILLASVLVTLSCIRIKKQGPSLCRFIVGLVIFCGIIFSLYGGDWQYDTSNIVMPYKAGSSVQVNASLSLHIGLTGINITYKGNPPLQSTCNRPSSCNETIDYNERFTWDEPWTQGRIGFGHFSFTLNQQFRAGQVKGLPLPILWVAEYFTFDGEGLRWGRYYKQAGYYAHISIWTALSCFVVAVIFSTIIIRYAAIALGFSGLFLLLANLIYYLVNNPFALEIHMAEVTIRPTFNWSFFLCAGTGILSILVALILFILDIKCRKSLYACLGMDAAVDNIQLYTANYIENENGNLNDIYELQSIPRGTLRWRSNEQQRLQNGMAGRAVPPSVAPAVPPLPRRPSPLPFQSPCCSHASNGPRSRLEMPFPDQALPPPPFARSLAPTPPFHRPLIPPPRNDSA